MRSPIDIHEFSTGINFQLLDSSGRWVSRGFTGQYMNNTLAKQGLPPEVEQAIAEREFAVSEGAYTKEPAIIARGLPDSPWSVIAVVSRGEDEKGRSASFYRYFLCEEPAGGYEPDEDGISILLNWMTDRKKETKQWPHFHPQPLQRNLSYYVQTPYSATPEAILEKRSYLEDTQRAPYIWKADTDCVPLILHGLTKHYMRSAGLPLAWAFNAGALESPWSFTIIYPADAKAEGLIRRAIASPPPVRVAGSTNEQALNTAIKTLTTLSSTKPDAVKVIFGAAATGQVPYEVWMDLFDKRGAKKAIDHSFHSPEMVKLMTLRAIVVPSTLVQFLVWIGLLNARKQPTEIEKISVDFQRELSLTLAKEQLADRVDQSIDKAIAEIVMPALLDGRITADDAYRLVSIRSGFWGKRFPYFLKMFEQGIEDIYGNIKALRQSGNRNLYGGKLWQGIWALRSLASYSSREARVVYYTPLINLFVKVGDSRSFSLGTSSLAYQLAAYLSQISNQTVESSLYKSAFPIDPPDRTEYLHEVIQRRIPLQEEIVSAIGSFLNMEIMKLWQVLILSSVTFAAGIASGVVGIKYGEPLLSKISWPSGAETPPSPIRRNDPVPSKPLTPGMHAQQDETIQHLEELVVKISDEFGDKGIDLLHNRFNGSIKGFAEFL
ncbi:MAG: hypothetical protein DCF15_19690 [Phormidesmis priestleyi]|uniref:Uncharacterized protein n=1 Tax=Phormidesmis priestleyi TaxID=268141 RepID=A0A2W4WPP4_9CYAN|nr:MAG: hypothetical protein DCF15_19690 [Phormidesmis priestleyi]